MINKIWAFFIIVGILFSVITNNLSTLNSEILIPNKDKYDIYLTIDNGIIEAFVDDEYSLTGHTAMDENPYSISFSSNNNCSINNININKLIPYFNLY